jgi:DNA-binding MarR family transcriptional regulator
MTYAKELSEELAELDKLVHEPARLVILTALSGINSCDFLFLQNLTGLSAGNLSGHLSRLEEAGMIAIHKRIINKRPKSTIRMTPGGQKAVEKHWKQLDALRHQARRLKK